MNPLRRPSRARAAALVVVTLPALAGVALAGTTLTPTAAASSPIAPGSVVGAATSVGASAGSASGSLEALPPGSHAGSVGSLDTGSDLATMAGTPVPACPDPAPRVTTFGDTPPPVLGWSENLAFDDLGRVWVAKTFLDRVDAHAPDGSVVDSVSVRAPGGIALGPDGRMHVAAGTGYLADRSDVVTFDPAVENPGARIEARLDGRMNGLAVDSDGNRYLTSLDQPQLTRVTADGEVDTGWSERAAIGVSNGIAIEGDTAYVSQSTSRTVLHAVPLDRPEEATETVLTSPPAIPRGLDDLAVTPEALYVTSWTTGEIYRLDRATDEACVLISGIPRATSVVVADGFGDYGSRDLLVTSLHGPIRHVQLSDT